MVVGRNPVLNIDFLWTTVVMAQEPTTPGGWTGGNTDILVTAGQCGGNMLYI